MRSQSLNDFYLVCFFKLPHIFRYNGLFNTIATMMKARKTVSTYCRLRSQPLWRLLASDQGPTVIGLLQTHLYDDEKLLPASILYERIERDLETLRAEGESFPQKAQTYISNWVAEGFLVRRFSEGSTEEEYELSVATVDAIRFASGLVQPHSTATESRLALVIEAIIQLAEDTDRDKFHRIDRLMAEQARIDKEINAIQKGQMRVLPHIAAAERVREIITLADELIGDFRRVRDQFEYLNRDLRMRIMDTHTHRGEVLDSLFAGMDLITESDAGRTFSAFWRLLTDPEQASSLEYALEQVMSREFMTQLEMNERQFLLRLTHTLLKQGGMVHEVLQAFAHSLKHFVQSREYLEQRRVNQLLNESQQAALKLKNETHATEMLQYTLALSSCRIRSLSQWVLYNPALQALPSQMNLGEVLPVDLESVAKLLSQSEIDFRTLKQHILSVLHQQSTASIAEILTLFPAAQGLGTIVGFLALGSKHGMRIEQHETVSWIGNDEQLRRARIPKIFFIKERSHELA